MYPQVYLFFFQNWRLIAAFRADSITFDIFYLCYCLLTPNFIYLIFFIFVTIIYFSQNQDYKPHNAFNATCKLKIRMLKQRNEALNSRKILWKTLRSGTSGRTLIQKMILTTRRSSHYHMESCYTVPFH